MKFIKISTLSTDVHDVIGVYKEPDGLLTLLRSRYEGRCYDGCFIVKIARIIRRTQCSLTRADISGAGTVSAVCELEVIQYSVGEVICGCTVKERTQDDILVGGPPNAVITLLHDPDLEAIAIGNIIPVRVVNITYSIFARAVSIIAVKFSFHRGNTAYALHRIDPTAAAKFDPIFARIESEEAARAEGMVRDSEAYSAFTEILYAYKIQHSDIAEKKQLMDMFRRATAVDLGNGAAFFDLARGDLGYISRDARMDLMTPFVYTWEQPTDIPTGILVRNDIDSVIVLTAMFEDYYSNLRMCREMVETYNTEELMDSHDALWKILLKGKF